jgi:hypothetical protein
MHLFVLTPQPDQFVAFGRSDNLDLLFTAAIPSIGHRDSVSDRLRGRFEVTREIIGIAAGADQVDYLPTKFRRVRQAGFGHGGSLQRKCGARHQTGSTSCWHSCWHFHADRKSFLSGNRDWFCCKDLGGA